MKPFVRFVRSIAAAACVTLVSCPSGCSHPPSRGSPSETPPDELDAWLSEREEQVPGIRPGTEKQIVWAGEPGEKTPISIIYIHGFSATRGESAPVCDQVAKELGANLFYTRLTGHGRDGEAMGEATLEDWQADVREAWEIGRLIGDVTIVVGMSTGAPLAAWLATDIQVVESHGLSALVLISPNFAPADKAAKIILWAGGMLMARLVVGKYTGFEPQNELHAYYWTSSYRSKALRPMMQACRLGTRAPLEEVQAPTLFLYTENDEVVSIPALLEAYERFGSEDKSVINVTEAQDHNLAGDIISPETTRIVLDHILRFLAQTP